MTARGKVTGMKTARLDPRKNSNVPQRQRHRQRKSRLHAGSLMWDSIRGLDPGTPGSCPGPKAGTKPLSHTGIPHPLSVKVMLQMCL